jgi:hypothetical protein
MLRLHPDANPSAARVRHDPRLFVPGTRSGTGGVGRGPDIDFHTFSIVAVDLKTGQPA